MSMSVGNKGGLNAEINMTPMIDVLLVLLIIFMVVQQQLQKGLSVQVPPTEQTASAQSLDQIVLEVLPNGVYSLNKQELTRGQLGPRLREVYDPRPRKVIFIRGDEGVTYGDVTWAVDTAKAAGIEVVGLVPRNPGGAPPATGG